MRFLGLFAALLVSACAQNGENEGKRTISPVLASEEALDDFTFAKPLEARVSHLALDLNLDFDDKIIAGTATLDVIAAEGATEIILDSDGLLVEAVTDGSGKALDWAMGETVDDKGEPLTIGFASDAAPANIIVTYSAAPEADALQWLSPEQTAGKEHEFLFSQGQAILNRSWIPTQDSPGVRQSWEARITAPEALNVVMSAIKQGEPEDLGDGTRMHSFRMDNPVAPYLIAIAAGDIAFADLGPRSGVWAEPAILESAVAELSDTEAMIDAAEATYGPYRWGRYDMIVLPPAFPYGGMENPVMTFLTPTFIAGDRSNTGLIAHELAHSWSGNLVTYASWRDGWLNEGVTSYLEGRIREDVFGEARAMQERALSFAAVEDAISEHGPDSGITSLRTPDDLNPLDYDSAIIYDKGAAFLVTIETIIGREKFDTWIRSWFDRHAFQPATSEMFIADLREKLVGDDQELDDALMLEEWIYGTGIPENVVRPDPNTFIGVDGAVRQYAESRKIPEDEWGGWTTPERLRFLQNVPQGLTDRELELLNDWLDLSETGNNEIRFLWLEIALKNQYDPAVPEAQEFLRSVGRNKFVEPLFEALVAQGEWGMAIANPLYQEVRPSYHSYTRSQVDPLLGIIN